MQEGRDYVVCQLCGHKCGCINHLHLRIHDITMAEYKELYPNAQLTCDTTRLKRAESCRGQVRSAETKAKQSAVAIKRWSDPEERERNSTSVSKFYVDHPEARRVISDNTKKQWEDPTFRDMMSENTRLMWEDPEYRAFMSDTMKELQKDGGFGVGYKHTDDAKLKIRDRFLGVPKTPEHCQHISDTHLDMSGENNPNWKGGKSDGRNLFMSSEAYHEWKTSIYHRDNYTCKQCGAQKCLIHAHHIYPYRDYPEPQFSLNLLNGITLCVDCHRMTFGKEYDFISCFLDATMGINTQHEILISGTQMNE